MFPNDLFPIRFCVTWNLAWCVIGKIFNILMPVWLYPLNVHERVIHLDLCITNYSI